MSGFDEKDPVRTPPSQQRMVAAALRRVAWRIETEVTIQTHSEGYARGRSVEKVTEEADMYEAMAAEQDRSRVARTEGKRVPQYFVRQEKNCIPDRWAVYRCVTEGMWQGFGVYTDELAANQAAEALSELAPYELDVALQG